MPTPIPGSKAPKLIVNKLGGGQIDLEAMNPEHFSILFFYRGYHCPLCKKQLEELHQRKGEFDSRGYDIAAISMDSEERAQKQKSEWSIGDVPVGYGLSRVDAEAWGLFLSKKEKDGEPELFNEPGVAVIYPDGTIYALYYQSVPFARQTVDDLLWGLDFIVENSYPARGTLAA